MVLSHVAKLRSLSAYYQWRLEFKSSAALLESINSVDTDVMLLRDDSMVSKHIKKFTEQLPILREERLPGVKASQSPYDRIGYTSTQLSLCGASNH